MSAPAKLGALIWHFMSPHSHWWVLNHSICLCLLVQVASSGSLKFYTPLKHPYKHTLTSPLLTYKISHDMWEPTSKLGASTWHFIWLLIRMIPSYLRDCNPLFDCFLALFESPNQWHVIAATQQGFPCCVAASLHHCSMPLHRACDMRLKMSKKVQYVLQKTLVWKIWWLFCDLNIVF